jgi:hypothetical protein
MALDVPSDDDTDHGEQRNGHNQGGNAPLFHNKTLSRRG